MHASHKFLHPDTTKENLIVDLSLIGTMMANHLLANVDCQFHIATKLDEFRLDAALITL